MKIFLLPLFSLLFFVSQAQDSFITTWDVTTGNLDITIPTNTEDYTYNYIVDFGDGTILTDQTENATHEYTSPGVYTVSISGEFPQFHGSEFQSFDEYKVLSVEQWGNIEWLSMDRAFKDCENLVINATDTPDLSQVTNMFGMFSNAQSLDQSLNDWDVSNVTNMGALFLDASSFNQPLDNWDVSNVADMSGMFRDADSFNQPLENWDVTGVVDMTTMFRSADSFDQPLNGWDVSNVEDMRLMFHSTEVFNQPLNNWDVSNVEWMMDMFFNTLAFNQPLDNWDVTSVSSMEGMFSTAQSFDQPLNSWDVSNVTTMSDMFRQTDSFNQPLNNWDVSNVTGMSGMFRAAEMFDQPLNDWDVSSALIMDFMFRDAETFNQPLDSWDISNVYDLRYMFENAGDFNQDISNWNFSTEDLNDFLENSGMDVNNYDLFLDRLVQLGIEDGSLGAANVRYCDAFTRQQLIGAGWNIGGDEIADDCDINYVSGTVLYDEEGDGCEGDENDFVVPNFMVNINDGQNDAAVAIDENGEYLGAIGSGNFTLDILNLGSTYSVSPGNQSANFTGTGEIIEDLDFCVTANEQIDDLAIDVIPYGDPIPGFESNYLVVFYNNGTQTVPDAEITFTFGEVGDEYQSFVSATVTPTSSTSNSLTFAVNDIEPFYSGGIFITLQNATPPNLSGGEVINFTAEITPTTNDETIEDNTATHVQSVVNSFDPNDKLVIQGEEIDYENIGEFLDYRIRFQNVGTANALNVVITDTISDKLDWTTFQPISSSHDYRIELIGQEEINFIFDNINLPYEDLDEEGSNGYITFKIKPKSDVEVGDVIENTAYIFFDFNPPIITNTVSTTIVGDVSIEDLEKLDFSVYPNPVKDILHLNIPPEIQVHQLSLYNISGQLVKSFDSRTMIKLEDLNSGTYFLQIDTNLGSFRKGLVKD